MKLRNLALVILLALSLSGCSWLSNNSDDKTSDTDVLSHDTLISVPVDNRTWIEVESPCPMAVQLGDGSCNVKVTK